MSDYDELIVIKGNAVCPNLARSIKNYLGQDFCEAEIMKFKDGETFVHIQENVRGKDAFVIQSNCRTYSQSVNDNLMELLFIIDTLKRASAERITAVIPYFGYARQDRKHKGRVPISAKLVANLIEVAGADRVLTMDLHAGQIQGFFNIPVDNLFPHKVLVPPTKKLIDEEIGHKASLKVASPDVGGVKRARGFAERLGVGLVIVEKRREGKKEEVEALNVIGEVKGCNVILVDDIIDTFGTMNRAGEALKREGAREEWAIAPHGIFADQALERIKKGPIKKVLVGNTVPPLPTTSNCCKIEYIEIGTVMGRSIEKIHKSQSLSEEFDHT